MTPCLEAQSGIFDCRAMDGIETTERFDWLAQILDIGQPKNVISTARFQNSSFPGPKDRHVSFLLPIRYPYKCLYIINVFLTLCSTMPTDMTSLLESRTCEASVDFGVDS